VRISFVGEIIEWRGPAPHHFVAVPDEAADEIASIAHAVTYGWGAIPAIVVVKSVTFTTSLFPKDGGYLVPIKAAVRNETGLTLGDDAAITLIIGE
jgi:hypothetical protein